MDRTGQATGQDRTGNVACPVLTQDRTGNGAYSNVIGYWLMLLLAAIVCV